MIRRGPHLQAVESALKHNPICAILGPRQCGKTTLAQQVAKYNASHYFDLETAVGRARLAQPDLALTPLKGLVVIDEIQRQPELFTALRPLADRRPTRARFLILGRCASPGAGKRQVLRSVSSGRVAHRLRGPGAV